MILLFYIRFTNGLHDLHGLHSVIKIKICIFIYFSEDRVDRVDRVTWYSIVLSTYVLGKIGRYVNSLQNVCIGTIERRNNSFFFVLITNVRYLFDINS